MNFLEKKRRGIPLEARVWRDPAVPGYIFWETDMEKAQQTETGSYKSVVLKYAITSAVITEVLKENG